MNGFMEPFWDFLWVSLTISLSFLSADTVQNVCVVGLLIQPGLISAPPLPHSGDSLFSPIPRTKFLISNSLYSYSFFSFPFFSQGNVQIIPPLPSFLPFFLGARGHFSLVSSFGAKFYSPWPSIRDASEISTFFPVLKATPKNRSSSHLPITLHGIAVPPLTLHQDCCFSLAFASISLHPTTQVIISLCFLYFPFNFFFQSANSIQPHVNCI